MKWYLSFVGDDRKFRGGCVVEADSLEDAITQAWLLQINPGGHVMGIPFDNKIDLPLYRLMDRAELEKYGPTVRRGDLKNPPQIIGNN